MTKRLLSLLLLLTISSAFAQVKPKEKAAKEKEALEILTKTTAYIIDEEDIYTPDQERMLQEIIDEYRKRRGVEFVIVSVADADKFKSLSLKDVRKWDTEKAEDNGILLAISKGLHRMRIQNGNKAKERVSDAETRLIIDAFCVPKFKNNDYYQGTLDGIIEIIRKIK